MPICSFSKLKTTHLFFLFYVIVSELKSKIKSYIEEGDESEGAKASQKLFYIIIYIISDIFNIIFYLVSEFRSKRKLISSEQIKAKNVKKKNSRELIYIDLSIKSRKYLYLVAITDFIAQITVYFYYLFQQDDARKEELSSLLIPEILFKYIFSRCILKTYFYKHHYLSILINIIGLLFLGAIDFDKIFKVPIYIIAKLISIIFYCLSTVLGKKALTDEFSSVYYLLGFRGIIELILMIILCMSLFIIQKVIVNDESYFNFFFGTLSLWPFYIILLIANLLHNISFWFIIDIFSPQHSATANVLDVFFLYLFSIIFEYANNNEKTEGTDITIIKLCIYVLLIIGTLIHNEIVIFDYFGFGDFTMNKLEKKALNDSKNCDVKRTSYSGIETAFDGEEDHSQSDITLEPIDVSYDPEGN